MDPLRAFRRGDYGAAECVIQKLLKENGATDLELNLVGYTARAIEARPGDDEGSPESYIGSHLAERFSSLERLDHDMQRIYSLPSGSWNVNAESAVSQAPSGRIAFRFHSRDLHLVMAATKNSRPVRIKVTLDGVAPSAECGADSAPDGTGEVREPRLYQLIRQKCPVKDRTFDPTCKIRVIDYDDCCVGIWQGKNCPDFTSLKSDESPTIPIIFDKKSAVFLISIALKPLPGKILTFNRRMRFPGVDSTCSS